MIYSLIGVAGCGKQAVGQAVSEKTGIELINGTTFFKKNVTDSSRDSILICENVFLDDQKNIDFLADFSHPIWIKKSLKIILQDKKVLSLPQFYGDRILFLDDCVRKYTIYKKIAKFIIESTDEIQTADDLVKYIQQEYVW